MGITFSYNSGWYIILFGFIIAWIALLLRRKSFGKKEIKEQILTGVGGMTACILMELFAIYSGLWLYTTGNWPAILWPTYFSAILFGYQLLRSIESFLHKPIIVPKPK
jgi:hypothetical protein